MKILIDIGHPAHVHLFKNFAWEMQDKGHEILFTCREKEFEIDLLKSYNFNFTSFGEKFNSLSGKAVGLLFFNFKLFKAAKKFKPDLFISVGSMYAAQVSWLFRKPHISMEDTGNMEQIRFYLPFTKVVLTPDKLIQNLGAKQIKYNSFHEIAYLTPKYYKQTKNIYNHLGINENTRFAILRFVSWNATHDIGQGGFTVKQKDEIVDYLSTKYKLFISAESGVPERFKKFLINIPPQYMHDALSFASLVVSEGATMASEAGILGTPTIYVNSLRACNNENLESYGLVYNFNSGDGVLKKIKQIENIENRKEVFQKRREKFLSEKIDLTAFLTWFIENYPTSIDTLKINPDYQDRFK